MKPRVHHVITRLIAGGAQENTLLSCRGLMEQYEVTLVTGPPDGREGSLLEDARRHGVPTLVLPDLIRPVSPARDLAALRSLCGIFHRDRPDIVHTHSSKAGILARAAAWEARVPVVVHTNHGLPFFDGQPWPVRATYRALEKIAARVTHRIVCVGEVMLRKSVAAGIGPPDFFEVIPSGIEIERFVAAKSARGRLGIPEEARVLGIVARMAAHKGHRYLIEAAPAGTHLLLVGDGEERPGLERLARQRGLPALFTGHVAPAEVPDLIGSMDILVHPSLWEGLPRAPVQALLAGRPVVAFDCDGASEVVIDGVTGRLVPPKSVEGLRAAIESILALPDRGRALGEEGRNRCRGPFEWRSAAARMHDLYQRLLDRSRTPLI